jgi:NAD-dependent dihydropyrimidine dehydrogenase PreA subunit
MGNNGKGFVAQDYVFRHENVSTGDFIKYNESKCNGCGVCHTVCAANLWAVPKDKKTRLSPKYRELCMECAACYLVCEQDAIDFRYPNGGSGIIIKHG